MLLNYKMTDPTVTSQKSFCYVHLSCVTTQFNDITQMGMQKKKNTQHEHDQKL